MTYGIAVSGQSCIKYDRNCKLAADSIDFVEVVFQLPSEWAGLECVAQFAQNDKCYNKALVDGKCKLPNEMQAGEFSVSVFGYEAGQAVRGTTIPLVDIIEESGFRFDGATPVPPTPDLYAQLLEKINQTEAATGEYADAAKRSAGAAKASEDGAASSATASAKTSKEAAAKSAADADSTANSIKDSMAQISENKEAVNQLKGDVINLSKVGHWETVLEGTVETAVITPIEYNEETGEYTCDAADLIGMDVGDSFPVITVPTKEMDAKYYPMGNNLTLTITSTTSYTLSCSIKSFCQSDFTAFPYTLHKSVSVPYVSVKSKRARVTVYGPFFVPMNYYEGGVPPVGPSGHSGSPTYVESHHNNTASFESKSYPNGHSVYEVESYISKPFTRVSKICNRLYFASSQNTLHWKSITDNYISCVDPQSKTYQAVTTKDGLNLDVMNMGNKTIRMGNGAMYKIERWIE